MTWGLLVLGPLLTLAGLYGWRISLRIPSTQSLVEIEGIVSHVNVLKSVRFQVEGYEEQLSFPSYLPGYRELTARLVPGVSIRAWVLPGRHPLVWSLDVDGVCIADFEAIKRAHLWNSRVSLGLAVVFGAITAFAAYSVLRLRGKGAPACSAVIAVRAGWTMAVLMALVGIGVAVRALCFRDGPMQSAEVLWLVFAEILFVAMAVKYVLSARRHSNSPSDDGPSNPGVESDRNA